MNRRTFLKDSALLATSVAAPGRLFAGSPDLLADGKRRVLVAVELVGGCDGLNSVVPFAMDDYYAARPALAIPPSRVLKLTDTLGLHPAMAPLRELYDDGKAAVILGIGYPRPSRSHRTARSIWYRGDPNSREPALTQGSFRLDGAPPDSWPALSGIVGDDSISIVPAERLETGGTSAGEYPDTAFAAQLRAVARAVRSGHPARVYHLRHPGFDTHRNQVELGDSTRGAHSRLLETLSSGVRAFIDDTRSLLTDQEVLLMTFSEFGRRLRENACAGTDHGTANVMFFVGATVRPGFHGVHPGLGKDETDVVGDMVPTVDFRRVYATVTKWLGTAPEARWRESWEPLTFL